VGKRQRLLLRILSIQLTDKQLLIEFDSIKRASMYIEDNYKQVFDRLVNAFILEEINHKGLAGKVGQVKYFDQGSKWIIERDNESPVVIEPKEYVSKAFIKNDAFVNSDFDTVRAFLENLADKMVDQQNKAIIEEMTKNAGLHVDAKGDILGGLIESAKQLRKIHGHDSDLLIIINPKQVEKLAKAMMDDPKRAEELKGLVLKRA
jgi:hypothetical protein